MKSNFISWTTLISKRRLLKLWAIRNTLDLGGWPARKTNIILLASYSSFCGTLLIGHLVEQPYWNTAVRAILTQRRNQKGCEMCWFGILLSLRSWHSYFTRKKMLKLHVHHEYLQLLVTSWTSCSSNLDFSSPGTIEGDSHPPNYQFSLVCKSVPPWHYVDDINNLDTFTFYSRWHQSTSTTWPLVVYFLTFWTSCRWLTSS